VEMCLVILVKYPLSLNLLSLVLSPYIGVTPQPSSSRDSPNLSARLGLDGMFGCEAGLDPAFQDLSTLHWPSVPVG
jgi:hypothetical protein